ncbi:fatty acyl-CoA reductase 1-like [Ctenocephalides felis]|uniref:fatty acyl-CoA reductase 1-like n=1 Tax=Ctenocephalides felis TaxID=7515 RepID=UPI000E6E5A8D|nr:fatty acyl-CoA reductase 1-like [Ctenocephalides felis]
MYLLIRTKKNQSAQERVKTILDNEIFDTIKKSNPSVLNKVVAVSGDVSELELGLQTTDKKLVLSSNVVFHAAASVRFDDPLKKATLMNTRGTREVMELMLQMPNLVVGVHVSTTYCNTDKDVIEEKVYRDHGDWREAIRIAENFEDEYKMECLTGKCLRSMKNTYIYTKHLAENVVEDYSDRLPLVIYRPGVVVSIWKDPLPGWTDNINGPIGLNVASGKGFLRVIRADPAQIVDDMPVDLVINGLVAATWKKGTKRDIENLPVYNCTMEGFLRHTHKHVRDVSLEMISNYPYNGTIWYPFCDFTKNALLFKIKFLLYNALVAIVVDSVLKPLGKKPLNNYIVDASSLDLYDYMVNARIGTSKYLLREEIDLPTARFQYKLLVI